MKIITVFLVAFFILSGIASANNLAKANIVPRSTLYKLLGTAQASAVHAALSRGKIVVAAYPRPDPYDYDLHILDVDTEHDKQGVIDILKAVVNRQEDNVGYIFIPNDNDNIKLFKYYYYTDMRQEWVVLADDKRMNMSLTLDEVKYISADYSLQQALADNFFYMQRYKDKDQSSVRYLREIRLALSGKIPEELDEEMRRHNFGDTLIRHEYLQELVTLVDGDSINQRRLQRMLMAIKAEIAAEELVVQLQKGELSKENFTTKQVEYTERVVRLKNASIAARNRDVHGKLHFYAFRIPRQYLESLLNTYAEKNDLSESAKQELEKQLFRGMEVNFKAVKFGQTDSARQLEILREELSHQEYEQLLLELGKQQEPPNRTGVRRKKNKKGEREPSKRVKSIIKQINMDNGDVDARIHEQLRGIIDVQVLAQIGGKAEELLKEAKILSHAPSLDIGMLDTDFLYPLLEKEDVEFTEMVDGKGSNETVVFLDGEGKEFELNEETLKLVRDRFKESVGEYTDYLDRRNRPSVSYPKFSRVAGGHKKEAEVTEPTPLEEVWQRLLDTVRSERNVGAVNTKLLKVLGLHGAYHNSIKKEQITYKRFSKIETVIIDLKDGASKKAQKLLDDILWEFIEFTPVIAIIELMAAKIDEYGEITIDVAVEYVGKLNDRGPNNKLENLAMIYAGLQWLGNDEYIRHFKSKFDDKQTLEKIRRYPVTWQINELWQRLLDAVRSKKDRYTSKNELLKELRIRDAHQKSLANGYITHTYFSNIEAAIAEVRKKTDTTKESLAGFLWEFTKFTPVIANPQLMAAKIEKYGEKAIDEAVEYVSSLRGSTNGKLENLILTRAGLQWLGNNAYIEYFESKFKDDKQTLERIQRHSVTEQINDLWQRLLNFIRNNMNEDISNKKPLEKLKLAITYYASLEKAYIAHTYLSKIEEVITVLKDGANEATQKLLDESLQEFIEVTPVIANPQLMTAKIEKYGKKAIDEAVDYAREVRHGGNNTRLENLTLLFVGLEELGNNAYIEYFESKFKDDKQTLERILNHHVTEQIRNLWQKLLNTVYNNRNIDTTTTEFLEELKLANTYYVSLEKAYITYTHFSHIGAAVAEVRKGADATTVKLLNEILLEFVEFTPVIDNPELMAAKIEKYGKKAIDDAWEYISHVGTSYKLKNLTMLHAGLKGLGNNAYIEYFEGKFNNDRETLERIRRYPVTGQINDLWQMLLDTTRSKMGVDTSNSNLIKKLDLRDVHQKSLEKEYITYTYFSKIEKTITFLKDGVDETIQELLDEILWSFVEFTPVIANPELMAAKIEMYGEKVIDEAWNYASGLKGSINSKLENLTLFYVGLKELGNDDYTRYFEQRLDKQTLEEIKSRAL